MINTDTYAYASRLKNIDPMQKFVFALLTLGVCLWADHVFISLLVIGIMGGITVFYGGTPVSFFIKLMLIPLSFLLIGVLTILINISPDPGDFLWAFPVGNFWVGVSEIGLVKGITLFFRVLGSVTCLYFLSLTTPMVDLFAVLRKLKLPILMIEMMSLIYRFIFVLLDTAATMSIAQKARLGYSTPVSSLRSLGSLAATLFIHAYQRSVKLYISLEARGYNGELQVVEISYIKSNYLMALAIGVNGLLVFLGIMLNR